MCGCLSCASYWRPGPQTRQVSGPGIELVTLWSQAGTQPTEHTSQGCHLTATLSLVLT